MESTYDRAISAILNYEGGYSDDAGDPGGPTKYGITIHDVHSYLNPHATAADVKALTVEQAKEIYRKHYAEPIEYAALPAGVDFAVLDYGVNSGISRAVKQVQNIIDARPDGVVGPETIAQFAGHNPTAVINSLCDERMEFLRGLHTFRLFGRGWSTRVRDVRSLALHMAASS